MLQHWPELQAGGAVHAHVRVGLHLGECDVSHLSLFAFQLVLSGTMGAADIWE